MMDGRLPPPTGEEKRLRSDRGRRRLSAASHRASAGAAGPRYQTRIG